MPKVTIRQRTLASADIELTHKFAAAIAARRPCVHLDIAPADLVYESKSLTIIVQTSDDGQTWRDLTTLYWRGFAQPGKGDGNPGFAVDARELANKYLRLQVKVPQPITVGIVGEI